VRGKGGMNGNGIAIFTQALTRDFARPILD
jgi:hypothetical protein